MDMKINTREAVDCEQYIDHNKTGEFYYRSILQKKAAEIDKLRQDGKITHDQAAEMMDNARGRLRY